MMRKTEALKIVKEYPDLKNNIEVLNLVLLDLQKWLLRHMAIYKRPTTTRSFFTKIMNDLFARRIRGDPTGESDILESGITQKIPDRLVPEYAKRYNAALEDGTSPTNIVEDIIKPIFNKHRLPYPSYNKIENDLKCLKDWGIFSNYRSGPKIYWIINPKFFLMFKKDLHRLK
ncbi:MAG: hypothetical protein ABIB47_01320 [Candidatus Woesearchaeota archaeon]